MPVVRISEELFKEVQRHAEPLVDNFETALWKALRMRDESLADSSQSKTGLSTLPRRRKRARSFAQGTLTPPRDFWKHVLGILIEKGGKAPRQEVHNIMKRRLDGRLMPGDIEVNRDGTLKWEKQVDYQRLAMANEGLLHKHSPRGIWEITDVGRQWISQH
jgi:hypothetical protein